MDLEGEEDRLLNGHGINGIIPTPNGNATNNRHISLPSAPNMARRVSPSTEGSSERVRKTSFTSPDMAGIAGDDAETLEHLLLDPGTQRFPAVAGEAYNSLPTYPLRPSYREYHFSLRPLSRCVVFDGCPDNPHKPASVPIYQTATFEQPSSTEFGAYDYTRSGNPTRTALEKQVAMLEFAHAAFAFSSGMAALNCVTRLLSPGDTILLTSDIYGGMHRLVQRVTSLYNINVVFIPTWDTSAVQDAFHTHSNVRLLHMESPSNPLMRVTDIRAISEICKQHGCLLSVDNTMMSPHLQQPINHGADIVIHSMTKFFGGHSDTMGGVVAVADESLAKQIAFFQNAEGTGLSPFDCWLFLRGIKTLALRVEQAQLNALQVATFLKRQDKVITQLFYAGLEPTEQESKSNEQKYKDFKIHMGQSKGGGSLLSFCTGNVELSQKIIDSLRLFKITVSFGSCNSLVEMPAYLSHASIPDNERTLPVDLVRLSIGIEDVNDLIDDLQQAFAIATNSLENGEATVQNVKKTIHSQASFLINTKTTPELPKKTPSESHAQNKVTPSPPVKSTFLQEHTSKSLKTIHIHDDAIYFKLDKNNGKIFLSFLLGVILATLALKLGFLSSAELK